jgi:sugar phosphate isomerase/epimerase
MKNLGFHCHGIEHFDKAIIQNKLKRGEFYNFPIQELPMLKEKIAQYHLRVSIHAPLVKPSWYPEPPTLSFLCDASAEKRQLSLEMIKETLEIAAEFNAEYVVVHFPVPSSTDNSMLGYSQQREIAWESAAQLSEMGQHYHQSIHLEGFGPSPFLEPSFLTEVIQNLKGLSYCFDTGHMNISAQRDSFDLYQFAQEIAPCVGSIHLWNNRGLEDYLRFRHIPVHPSQKLEEGWADIRRILNLIFLANPSCAIIFESGLSYPEALGNYNIGEGVNWVKEIVAGLLIKLWTLQLE